jgi:hypothetical protein
VSGEVLDITERRDARIRGQSAHQQPGSRPTGKGRESESRPRTPTADEEAIFLKVREVMSRIKYGTIVLTIHDGRIVQIEMAEKFRL